MAEAAKGAGSTNQLRRTCARRGCDALVKKPTAKYCSVRCCQLDPERQQRLRRSVRRSNTLLPMSAQLRLNLEPMLTSEIELPAAELGEDAPRGMSRLCG